MSFHQQLSLGYTVARCAYCNEPFWVKAEKASGDKNLYCRDCFQQRTGYTYPAPWARKLSPAEESDYGHYSDNQVKRVPGNGPAPSGGQEIVKEIDSVANEKGYALTPILEALGVDYSHYFAWKRGIGGPQDVQAIRDQLAALPSRKEEAGTTDRSNPQAQAARALTDDEIVSILRARLHKGHGNRFSSNDPDSYSGFAAAAGVTDATVSRIVKGSHKRKMQRSVRTVVEAEIRRRGWAFPPAGPQPQDTPSATLEAEPASTADIVRGWPAFTQSVTPEELKQAVQAAISVKEHGDNGVMLQFPPADKRSYEAVSSQMKALWDQAMDFFDVESFSIRIRYVRDEGDARPLPTPEPAAKEEQQQEPSPGCPYPDLQESDPRHTYKLLVNTCADALAKNPRHPRRDEIEKQMAEMKEMADAPAGYWPWSAVHKANLVNKLTSDEKLHCIRTLPLEIVQKLFPNL